MTPNIDLLLLAVLRDGPMHGYAVISALRERSDGNFDLTEGSVYPVLHRLEADGLLTSTMTKANGRARRTYRVTAAGVQAFSTQASQWTAYAIAVDAVIQGLGVRKGAHA